MNQIVNDFILYPTDVMKISRFNYKVKIFAAGNNHSYLFFLSFGEIVFVLLLRNSNLRKAKRIND